MTTRSLMALALVVLAAGCEFGETAIPDGEPIVVVNAVMRPAVERQWIIVERTLTGSESSETRDGRFPTDEPELPITGATVTVVNSTFVNDPCGFVTFVEYPPVTDLLFAAGIYWGPPNCPTMRAGDTLEMRVDTPNGEVVTGVTQVPGVSDMFLRVAGQSVTLPGPTLEMNRDLDTLEAAIDRVFGRAIQLEVSRIDSAGGNLPTFWFAVDSNTMTLPGNLPDFMSAFTEDTDTLPDDLPPVFAAGRYYTVTVAQPDQNYFDFIRSANLPLSGRGFINHLQGGMGLFGSMVVEENEVRVVGVLDDDREGTYNLSGTLLGTPVDVALELYVGEALADSTDLSAFVTGQWLHGPIDGSADGVFYGDTIAVAIFQPVPGFTDSISGYLVTGPTAPGTTTTLPVYGPSLVVVDSLELERPLTPPATPPLDLP